MDDFDITVVTVTRNAASVVRLTLESVMSQKGIKIQHVLIDGNSSDDTMDIVAEYEIDIAISEIDSGIYDAMEKSRKYVKGDYVIYLNAGDVFASEDVCFKAWMHGTKYKLDLIYGNLLPVYLNKNDKHDHNAFVVGKVLDLSYINNRGQLYSESIHHQATFYSKRIIGRASYLCKEDLRASGEYHLLLDAIFNHDAKLGHIPITISRFALGGLSTGNFAMEWKKFNQAREVLRSKFFPKGPDSLEFDLNEFSKNTKSKMRKKVQLKLRIKLKLKKSFVNSIYESFMFRVQSRIINSITPYIVKIENQLDEISSNGAKESHYIKNQLDEISSNGAKESQYLEVLREIANLSVAVSRLTHSQDRIENSLNTMVKLEQYLIAKSVKPTNFADAGYQVYSQFNEDGLIQFLVDRISDIQMNFIELGCGDYTEANTRLLLERNGWKGLIVDGDELLINRIVNSGWYWRYPVKAICSFVEKESFSALIDGSLKNYDVGLLSIDIDGMEYWIWKELKNYRPTIVVIEYNAIFGSEKCVTVPYDASFSRHKAHYSGLYSGASFAALLKLGHEKGYVLLGTNSGGNNMFFVLAHVAKKFGLEEDLTFRAATFRESRDADGRLTYLDSAEGLKLISVHQIWNLESNSCKSVKDEYSLN
jgi:glycosyltransferase involved in cell wall biosynthesis